MRGLVKIVGGVVRVPVRFALEPPLVRADTACGSPGFLVGVGFQGMRENFETTTAVGRLMLNILGSLAEFELELIRERVKAGMDRARRQGKRIGRPRVTDRRGFDRRFGAILERLSSGELSRRKAAFELGIGYATLKRLIDAQESAG